MKKLYLIAAILLSQMAALRAQSTSEWILIETESNFQIYYSKGSSCTSTGTIQIKIVNLNAQAGTVSWSFPETWQSTPLDQQKAKSITLDANESIEGACSSQAPIELTWFVLDPEWIPTPETFNATLINK